MAKIKASDAGTWLEGPQGWHNGYRAVLRAQEWGWTIPEEYRQGWNQFVNSLNTDADHDLWHDANGDDGGFVDAATDYLQELAPEGYVFRWDAGELSLTPAWMDCAADGGGCEVTGWREDGSEESVTPCRDHKPDHKIRVSPKVLAPESTTYAVMLWDENSEVLSGCEEITFTPPPPSGNSGEFWFPELIAEPRIRKVAERLIQATRQD
jgi:hypothetical protein